MSYFHPERGSRGLRITLFQVVVVLVTAILVGRSWVELDLADSPVEVDYWTRIFNSAYKGGVDSWAYPWFYACWAQRGLTVIPDENLVSNIGYGCEATHTTSVDEKLADLPTSKGQLLTIKSVLKSGAPEISHLMFLN